MSNSNSEKEGSNGKRDLWQIRRNPAKNVVGCPKMELKVPGRDTDVNFCLEHCVRKPDTEDLKACNPVEYGSYGGTTQ